MVSISGSEVCWLLTIIFKKNYFIHNVYDSQNYRWRKSFPIEIGMFQAKQKNLNTTEHQKEGALSQYSIFINPYLIKFANT